MAAAGHVTAPRLALSYAVIAPGFQRISSVWPASSVAPAPSSTIAFWPKQTPFRLAS